MMSFEQKIGRMGMVSGGESREAVPERADFEGRDVIRAHAELRRRGQDFRVRVLNMKRPEGEMEQAAYDKMLALCFREAKGEEALDPNAKSEGDFLEDSTRFRETAEAKREIFPRYAAYLDLRSAKCRETVGADPEPDIVSAGAALDGIRDLDPHTPANLLPETMLLGLWARRAGRPIPGPETVARAFMDNPTILSDYALALPERDRTDFLDLIPEEKRKAVSAALDVSVARVLHQSIVEKGGDDEAQRTKVRIRLNRELREAIGRGDKDDAPVVKLLAEALGSLGEDTRQLLLEIMRDEYEGAESVDRRETDHMSRVMQVLLERFDDWRGNDIALRVAASPETNRHLSIHILGKLVKSGYLPADVKGWWDNRKANERGLVAETERLDVIKKTVSELGVVPNRDILEFLADDREWKGVSLDERIERIRSSREEFSNIRDHHELAHLLSQKERKAKTYYLLHGGEDRFNLINNYDFGKFKEMLGLVDGLVIHERPLREFSDALVRGGLSAEESKRVTDRLRAGHGPFADAAREQAEVGFDVSENALVKTANAEIGQALGREQLGVVMLFPLYREFLESRVDDEHARELLRDMKQVETLAERRSVLDRIEGMYPEFRAQAVALLADDWKTLGEKMILDISLEHVFEDRAIPVRGEELLPRLDARRLDLKRMKKDLLVILKDGNRELCSVQKEIFRKRRARANLLEGLEQQADERKQAELRQRIETIESELFDLETRKAMIGDRKATDRFSGMSQEEKDREIEQLGNEILALTEKSPSAIFTAILMQVLGEERLREKDTELVREIESHLESPFQAIADATTYRKPIGESGEKKRARVRLQYLDKVERFMAMARFGDSKICCFSSSNYEMTIQHGMQNKFWVASIGADPLSFVVSIENPSADADDGSGRMKPKENLGFVFGSYGVDDTGMPAILLNGVYYAPGLEGKEQMEAILSGVEKLFEGLPIRTVVLAGRHGGSFGKDSLPEGYSQEAIEVTRLRALDDGQGKPESKIYDDLATGSDLNAPHEYGGSDVIWHKRLY